MDQLLKGFFTNLKKPISELWSKNKIFLICFFLLILVIKFQDVIFDYLVRSSKKLVKDANNRANELRQEQDDANNCANELRQEAQDLGENRPDVDEDWHKK